MDIQRDDLKQRKRRRQLLLGVLGAAALLAVGVGVASLEPAAPRVDRSSLWLDTVRRGEMLREVRGPGTLVPREVRWIAATTAARVERIVARPGAPVEADTVILELSNPEVVELQLAAEAALAAAEADYAARRMSLGSQLLDQRANFAAVKADYESARLQAEAERELVEEGIISRIQYRRSQLSEEQLAVRLDIETQRVDQLGQVHEAQLAADRARLAQLRNTAALRRRQAEGLRVTAGISGVLQLVPVEAGQQVGPGTNLARVAKPDQLMAELRIPETQVKDVALDQQVRVDTRNGIVQGRVSRIDPSVQNGAVLVDVELTGTLPAGARPDLSVDGTIQIERLEDVLHVGRPAYGQPESTVRLFRLDPESGVAHRIPVQLGRASVSVIEVRGGLQQGDQIILSDTSQWDEHDRLQVR